MTWKSESPRPAAGRALAVGTLVAVIGISTGSAAEARNYDARIAANRGVAVAESLAQQAALAELESSIPELAVSFDRTSGAVRTLYNRTGYLTGPSDQPARAIGNGFLRNNLELFGLSEADIAQLQRQDVVYSKATGATHLYLVQTFQGLPVYNGQLQFHVNRDGRLISLNSALVPDLASAVNTTVPERSPIQAIVDAANHLGIDGASLALSQSRDVDGRVTIVADALSASPIEPTLTLLPVRGDTVRLAWNLQIETLDGNHYFDMTVDAVSGKVWTRFDWVNNDSYRVYALPAESPNHVTPVPPADGRTLVADPADPTASPLAWHDTGSNSYTIHRGNNVHAYDDIDGNNSPPGSEPNCGGSLVCDFTINLNQAPSNYTLAAVTNLFYWNNLLHDVQYQYGFDEAGGNFQVNNFGNGGLGGDDVRAEAQDGSGINNANFFTPTDGNRPRMQMFLWTAPNPDIDGDLDNGIIAHEYGHGISIRQVGGPGNSSCLNNTQQPGEGWSDLMALWYTAEVGDAGTDVRGIGTYALNEPTDGDGIRTQPYSTDQGVNNWTFETISTGVSVPHGVGAVWAQGVWEAYWNLVDTYGFDPNLYNPNGGAGNQRMMLYINEGLKNTACSPTFLDARDGIIQAATDNYGGVDVCRLWDSFAAYGLGTDATTGGPNSLSATNGFSVPAECQCSPQPIADAGPDQSICLGESATIGTPALADHTYSWSPGGQTSAQITVSPSSTTTYTVTATTTCGSANDSVTVTVDDGTGGGLDENFEGGLGSWTATGLWHAVTDSSCASPGYSSPFGAVYYGQDSSCNYDTGGTNSGTLTSPSISGINSTSTLTFDYYRVVESFNGDYDRTAVDILSSSGTTTVFSLNASDASNAAWVSSGAIDLSAFAGDTIQVQFRFETVDNVSNNFTGWLVDDVVVTGESACTPGNTAPTVSISAPADGSQFDEGASISFSGTATDAEDGTLTGSLSWSSNLDGAIGSGGSFSTVLSVGTHTITASVTDSGGLTGSDSITVTVNPNTAPTVTITAPADGSTFVSGSSVSFAGTATDAQDGTLTGSLSWTSSLDGVIGSGGSFSVVLSVGTHTITASVTDSGGLTGSDAIAVTIAVNTPAAVSITAPADGSTFNEGSSVTFSGTATDDFDGDLSGSLSWTSDLDGAIGSGGSFSISTLSLGSHTITASVTDSGGLTGSDSIGVTIVESGGGDFIDWNVTSTVAYSNQDGSGTIAVEDGGATFFMEGNRWRRTVDTYVVTSNTVIEFEFQSTSQGEIHGIGFDENDTLTDDVRIFQIYGTQNWGGANQTFDNQYTNVGAFQQYTIPVGDFYTGSAMHLVLVNDKDSGTPNNTSRFRNVRIYEDVPPPGCVITDFESGGAEGWTNSGASTCTTGTLVVGTPTEVVNSGVTTQVGGDHTTGSGNAFFTAVNTSAGVNDVDGGNCIAESGTTSVAEDSTVSIWYFHGQRDAGDDPGDDFFELEISTDGGSSWSSLVSIGDVTSNAAWTEATTTVSAGADVRFRLQASDGAGPGDLVEAGVDDIEICPVTP